MADSDWLLGVWIGVKEVLCMQMKYKLLRLYFKLGAWASVGTIADFKNKFSTRRS